MLNIFLLYQYKNTLTDIHNYIKHIHNINKNIELNILITIINTNKKNILNKNIVNENDEKINENEQYKNINVNVYNYSCIYNDSLYNEIIEYSPYDILLFTNFETYLSEPLLEYILLNEVKINTFVRTNILELNTIPNTFYENYENKIFFTNIATQIEYINNENQKQNYDGKNYIKNFNEKNNDNILNISSDEIENHNIYYLNNTNDFLLIHKNTLIKYGFNTNNKNSEFTFQYCVLNLIKNNINMIKLPLILSVYKKSNQDNFTIIDTSNEFNTSNDFNKNIDYKLYDVKLNNEKSFIRSHIKILNGMNNNELKNTNKELKNTNKELKQYISNLEKKIILLKQTLTENNLSKNILIEKNKTQEIDHEKLKNKFNLLKKIYIDKLKIINSSINQTIINEINNFT